MSAPTNDGGSAFPLGEYVIINGVPITKPTNGMTLRDYFAAAAAQGCLAAPEEGFVWCKNTAAIIAKHAYEVADAMLAERSKGGAS